jgi:N-methylhydantoinase A
MSWQVGIDTGGTFTDLSAVESATGTRYVTKVLSTPAEPAAAIREALDKLREECGVSLDDISFFGHGTTVGTNAVLEGKGACTGLLITEGFNAIYEVRGGIRPGRVDLVDPRYRKPEPLVPLRLTRYVGERVGYDGIVLRDLDEASVRSAVRELREAGVESIAVLCLFSFVNPAHEDRIRQLVEEEHPGCRVSLSSRVLPVIREYVRLSTTVLDAYVGPVVRDYFETLERRLSADGLGTSQAYAMQSNGGLMRIGLAAEHPNEILLSGPAAGVAFAVRLGELTGEANLVTLDMGGTSTDVCVIRDGEASQTREGELDGQQIGTPMIEIHTLGTGGGTIGRLGKDGLMKVGPQSAGADPGPACYARGGTDATVTDADVILGYVDSDRFLGGRMQGDRALAEAALGRLGDSLGLSALDAAIGIHRIIDTQMAVGLRLTLESKGCDVNRFVLVPFGGAGPVHGWRIAEAVGIPRMLIPPAPGIGCARGLLETDVVHVYMQSALRRVDQADAAGVEATFAQLTERAYGDTRLEGFDDGEVRIERQLDMRYPHQGYELPMDISGDPITTDGLALLRTEFDARHEEVYGVSAPDEPAEIVNLRVRSVVARPRDDTATGAGGPASANAGSAEVGTRDVYFESLGGYAATPVYDRAGLEPGMAITGPAIIEQLDSTTVVGPGWSGAIDAHGNLRLIREGGTTA